jgi:hypothetical protein
VRRETSLPEDDFGAAAAELLTARVLRERFEQGCFLPANARDYLVASDEAAADLRGEWTKLDREARTRCHEIELQTEPGLPQGDITGVVDGFVILTQQCDLVREPALEPTLEVVPIRREPAKGAATLRSLRSWRQIVVADVGDSAIVADSRTRLLLDKRSLADYPALQILPDSALERRRFAWWAGARYFRRPVPTALFFAIEKPFRDALDADPELVSVADKFVMFIVDAAEPSPRLVGVFDDESDRPEMEEAMDLIYDRVPFEGLSDTNYDALPVAQTPLPLLLGATSYVLDLEGFSGEESPQPPALES